MTRGNRSPTDSEAENCFKRWLLAEMRMVAPKVVIALGNEAVKAVTGDYGHPGITGCNGQVTRMNVWGLRFLLVKLVHPSYVLRNPLEGKRLVESILPETRNELSAILTVEGN